jgi:hypothetical protein
MRSVDKQPSTEPDAGDSTRDHEDQAELSIVSGPVEEEERVGNETWTSNEEGDSKVTREDAPHYDGETQNPIVNPSEH